MNKKFRFTLKESFGLKVLFSFILVIILVLSAFTLFAVIREGEKTKKNLREQGEMLSGVLANSSMVGVFAENGNLLKDPANGILALKDVASVSVYNAGLKVLYAGDKKSSPKDAFSIPKKSAEGISTIRSTRVEETDTTFEFFKPIVIKAVSRADESLYFGHEARGPSANVIGYVRIVMSKDSYRKEIISVMERNALIMLVFICSSIAIIYFAVKKVTRPLENLTENVRALGKGLPVQQTPVESRDEIGNLASAFNAMVAARGHAEESLRQSEKKFRMLAETAAAAIFIYRGSSFRYLNSSTEKMTGYTRDELLGMDFRDLVHPDYRSLISELGAEHRQGEQAAFRCEFKLITKTGEERWVDFTSGTIEFEGAPAALGTAYDVTERKKLEEQFRQSQKMEAVGLLAGGMAHDFNNILTAIIGYGYLAKKKNIRRDSVISYVDQILSCAERGANLTQGLLAFSRKQIINRQPAKVDAVIGGINALLGRIIGEDITLKSKLSGSDMTILADTGQIEQVLMNLATNARHAMPEGGTLTIKTECVELDQEFIREQGYGGEGTYALVSLEDTGTGMDQKIRERIFEPFFTTKEMGKGTGLGLSIVYGIVKQHDGYITVSSEPGRGTTFKLYFPLVQPVVGKAPAAEPLSAVGGTETVLVAEDDEEVRTITTAFLAQSGYTVVSAADGEQAVQKFKENKESIDLVILDVIMPQKNGKEVWEEIKRIQPDIKALFITGYTSDVFEQQDIHEEGLKIISKPISPAEFLKEVRRTLDGVTVQQG